MSQVTDTRASGKGWLPEVREPMGISNTGCPTWEDGDDDRPVHLTVSPSRRDGEVWLKFEGRRLLVKDEHLAYALAGARKARGLGSGA